MDLFSPERWELANPARTLTEIIGAAQPRPGDVLVALLRCRAGGARELVDVTTVLRRGDRADVEEAAALLRRHSATVAGTLPLASGLDRPPEAVFLTVVCREGRVVPGPAEEFWQVAWLRSEHVSNAIAGDIVVLTEHGWTGCLDTRAGSRPALLPRPLTAVT